MMTVSELLPSRMGMIPTLDMLYPITPINTATAMEMTTHTVAILLDIFSLFSSSIAINLSKIWGMPK